ncbi:MAG: helix-turn-helix domain-containing protein [Clostridiales bacterium]|nr:helix-turn-helix domain-containing protein [Clostridiales bacterium]
MHLLIVDDDIATVDLIRHTVDWEALSIDKVEAAYSAAQARRILQRGKTDIVISDIEMPQGSGLDLLTWVRQQGLEVEFLLLTCHERFDYAASALKLDAAEYLTKPFDPRIMALSLQKTVAAIREKHRLREGSRYGTWRMENLQREEINFWLSLYNGGQPRSREQIRGEIEARGLPIDPDRPYRLVVTRIADSEPRAQELGQALLHYILENAHARHLLDRDDNTRAIRRFGPNGLWYFTAADDRPDAELRERCARVIAACGEAARVKATCCIGRACAIEALSDQPVTLQKLLERSVVYYGQAFTQTEAIAVGEETQVLEIDRLKDMLMRYDKVTLLNTLKEALASRTALRTLSERTLHIVQQELLQVVYAYLADAGVQAPRLFADEDSVRLSDQACRSSLDMIRWANYLIERTFAYDAEMRKTGSLVERIHQFIHEHYQENIGRNEVAAEFHLAPEYLAKLFKKKTDQSLKDAIREYRVEQAKRMLRDPEVRVGDVAGAVGFDSFSYFSTIFKRETGMTPQEYRRDHETGRQGGAGEPAGMPAEE